MSNLSFAARTWLNVAVLLIAVARARLAAWLLEAAMVALSTFILTTILIVLVVVAFTRKGGKTDDRTDD